VSAAGEGGAADVFVGMGSNVGDRLAHLRAAVAALDAAAGVRVVGASPVYETEAHVRPGTPPQRDHLNAVVRLAVDLAPLTLLDVLHAVERTAGRDPSAEAWSPRPLDLDVLLWDDEALDLPGLTVPHPRLAHRRFVLAPLADLAPERVVGGRTVGAWLASTADGSRVERTTRSVFYAHRSGACQSEREPESANSGTEVAPALSAPAHTTHVMPRASRISLLVLAGGCLAGSVALLATGGMTLPARYPPNVLVFDGSALALLALAPVLPGVLALLLASERTDIESGLARGILAAMLASLVGAFLLAQGSF